MAELTRPNSGIWIVRFEEPIKSFQLAGLVQQVSTNSGGNSSYALMRVHRGDDVWFTCGRADAENPARSVRVTHSPNTYQPLYNLHRGGSYTQVVVHSYDWAQPRDQLTHIRLAKPDIVAQDAIQGFAGSLDDAYNAARNSGNFPRYSQPDRDFGTAD